MPPDESSVKNGFRECLGSCAMVRVLPVMALLLVPERLELGRPMVLEACV